jgi:hypothetical protein
VPKLISSNLRIHAFFMAKACLRPAQDLKVHPTEADVGELLLDVPPKKIVA